MYFLFSLGSWAREVFQGRTHPFRTFLGAIYSGRIIWTIILAVIMLIGGIPLSPSGTFMTSAVHADIDPQAGTSGGRFFKMDFGARPTAMGGAYTASSDLYALQWNPAAGAASQSMKLAAQQTDLLLDMKAQYVGLGSLMIGDLSINTFGAFFDKGTFQRTTELSGGGFGGFDGTFDASDWQVGLNLARSFSRNLDVGVNIKHLQSRIESFEASATALDAGFQYNINRRYRLGMSVENLGEDIKFVNQEDPLPLTFNLGARARWALTESFGYQVNLDAKKPRDNEYGLRIGNELSVFQMFAFRAGYNSASDLSEGFSYGAGFKASGVQLDYAYRPSGDFFDRRQTFSISLRF